MMPAAAVLLTVVLRGIMNAPANLYFTDGERRKKYSAATTNHAREASQ